MQEHVHRLTLVSDAYKLVIDWDPNNVTYVENAYSVVDLTGSLEEMVLRKSFFSAERDFFLGRLRDLDPERATAISSPPKTEGCFPADALVLTPSGNVRIASLKVGDLVVSMTDSGRTAHRRITKVLSHADHKITAIKLVDGAVLRVTSNHTVLCNGRWLTVRDIKEGDTVETVGGAAVVSAIVPQLAQEPVYNLHTEAEHNFIVDGVVVHNFTSFRLLRTWWHRLVLDRVAHVRLPNGIVPVGV